MKIRDLIRSIVPQFALDKYRKKKKETKRKKLSKEKEKGEIITEENILNDLKRIGIKKGDTLLVHSSLSKIGYVEEGPKTVVSSLLKSIGEKGNLLMPSSPNASLQKDHIKKNKRFNVLVDKSALGAITEYFRKYPGVKRSLNATEPVCAYGPKKDYFVNGHLGEVTPYTENSPFYKVAESRGKILYIGVTLANAGTSLHCLEDAVDFEYPVYCNEFYSVEIVDEQGVKHAVKTRVHNPVWSAKRKCDELIPMFIEKGVCAKEKIGKANVLVFDAFKMLEVMKEEYEKNGVTMYHPKGLGV